MKVEFSFESSVEVLQRTPYAFDALLRGLSLDWIMSNEGGNTWSAMDVTAHLIYCDKANWLVRVRHILKYKETKPFDALNRLGGFELSRDKSPDQLLDAFIQTRKQVLEELQELSFPHEGMIAKGLHPQFGEVALSQLIAAWVVHDLSHLSQVCRVMAKQYGEAVGPWISFLRILNDNKSK